MAPRSSRTGDPGPSGFVFFLLLALLGALFVVSSWATIDEGSEPILPAALVATVGATEEAVLSPTTTSTATAIPGTPTSAIVVVERRPPTQTPDWSPTATPSPTPAETATVASTVTQTSTPTPPSPTPSSTGTPTDTATATASATPTPVVLTVQPGDNFVELGERFGIPWREIAAANGLPPNATLQPGQIIVIPVQR